MTLVMMLYAEGYNLARLRCFTGFCEVSRPKKVNKREDPL